MERALNRTTFLLRDSDGNPRARMTVPAGEPVPVEPWMLYCINQRGWRLEPGQSYDSGVVTHGWVEWEPIARSLATVLKSFLDENFDSGEDLDAILARARVAMTDFEVAEMEVGVAQSEVPQQQDGEPGGGTPE